MRIEEIHVYGFGQLRDVSYRFHEGLNVVEGLNEAGKTTLMAFIRGVLFGFASRRHPELRYEPAEGGKFGGMLALMDEDGALYRVERIFRQKVAGDVTVHLPDGSTAGEAFLNELFGKMNEKVFNNVFAFGLNELQQVSTLHEEEINHFIYTAGTGDGEAVRRAQKELTEREQGLFRPYGSKSVINVKFQELREAVQKRNELKRQNEQYEHFVAELQALDQQLAEEEARIAAWRKDINKLEKWQAHYDDYTRYIELLDRLAVLPTISSFPEDGVVRLETLEGSIRERQAELTKAQNERGHLEQQLRACHVNERLLAHQSRIEALRDTLSSYREHAEAARRCQLEARQEKERLAEICARLGPSWDEEKINAFDVSVTAKETVRHYASNLNAQKEAVSIAENTRNSAKREWEQQTEQLHEWETRAPERPEKTAAEITEERRQLERVTELEQERARLESRVQTLQEKINEYERTKESLGQTAHGGAKGQPFRWVLFGVTIAAPALMWFTGQPLLAQFLAFAVLALLTVREFVKREGREAPYEALVRDLDEKQRAAEQDLERLQQEVDALRDSVKAVYRRFDVHGSDVRDWERQLETAQDMRRRWEQWQEQYEEKARGAERARASLDRTEEEWQQTSQTYRKAKAAWTDWLQARQLLANERREAPGAVSEEEASGRRAGRDDSAAADGADGEAYTLTPETVLDIMREIETAKEVMRQAADTHAKAEAHCQYTAAYLDKLQSVITGTGVTLSAAEPELQVRELNDLLQEAREAHRRKQALSEQLAQAEGQVRDAEARLQAEKEALANLLKQGGAEDADDFRLRAEQYRERKELQLERELLERSFRRLSDQLEEIEGTSSDGSDESEVDSGGDRGTDRLLDHLSRTTPRDIADKLRTLEARLSEAHDRCDTLRNERATLAVKIEELATGTALSEQRLRCEQLLADVREHAKEWAVMAMGQHILQQAMHVYEQEKQPGVLKRASHFLREMTAGRHVRILAPLGEQTIEVERSDGRRFQPAYLSRGTVEQVYLAMRFALVEEYGKQPMLPVVLDDILVNFDPPRTRAAIRALKAIASSRQVLYFTCHAHLARMFTEVAGVRHHLRLEAHSPQVLQM